MTPVFDLKVYNDEMKKSLFDKLYFLDKIDANIIVDFGCAEADLIKFMYMLFPSYIYVGYDTSSEMIKLAKKNLGGSDGLPANIHLFDNWNNVKKLVETYNTPAAILLSSIIHEIYSYSNLIEHDVFWSERVFGGLFDYVVVRDMMPKFSINRRSEINDIRNIRKNGDKGQLLDFEKVWGSIEENKNLIHFLLKYRYVVNWNREVLENYFPFYAERFLEMIPKNYEIDYYEEFVLPFTKRTIERDFGIMLKDTTHVKCIMRKKNGVNYLPI